MSGKFVLEKGSTGKFHFNLHASNGQIIATSQHYETREAAMGGIKSVQSNAPTAAIVDETEKNTGAPKPRAAQDRESAAKK